jgi:hypothetical protein
VYLANKSHKGIDEVNHIHGEYLRPAAYAEDIRRTRLKRSNSNTPGNGSFQDYRATEK